MKLRYGFVSNSSSSSFIVIGGEPTKVKNVQLTDPMVIQNIIDSINADHLAYGMDEDESIVTWDGIKPVYLTQMLSDCGVYTDAFGDLEHHSYLGGQHNQTPYDWECDKKSQRTCIALAGDPDGNDEWFGWGVSEAVFIQKDHLPKKARKPAKKKSKI